MTVICLIKYYNKHLFFIFLLSLCLKNVSSQIISNSSIAGFFTPDSVCVNSPVNITNTSVGASTYYWNFCVADITKTPLAINLGNIGGLFSMPVFTDIVSQGGNYFVFVVNNLPGKLLRLNFGNSLLNTPTITNLGNFGGALHDNAEGIQIENDQKFLTVIKQLSYVFAE